MIQNRVLNMKDSMQFKAAARGSDFLCRAYMYAG